MRTGIELFLDMLADFGVRYLFGNPGTTELPLNDALAAGHRIRYVLGLQEVPVMAMADGYAMASGSLGVVNLHISCGLGHAMGILYNAWRERTPLLVTAGQQDRRLSFEEPILWGEMARVAEPWTKWSGQVERLDQLPTLLRRAVQAALTPPTGPVFLALPVDLQMELAGEALECPPIRLPDTRVRPSQAALRQAVQLLLEADNPVILAGSRVTEAGAMRELVAVAERLGAPVISEPGTTHGRLAFPSDHPLNGQGLPLWSPEVRERLAPYDVLLVVGMDLLRQYVYHEPARAIPEHLRIIHVDEDAWQLNKNYPLDVALLGHPAETLAELEKLLAARIDRPLAERIAGRAERHGAAHGDARRRLREAIDSQRHQRPMTPLTLMDAVARVVPDDVVVVEEAVTTTGTTLERLGALRNTTGYFAQRGWALGWGLGCAIGAKLAWPDRPTLALLGEGAAMYGIQGLWSAARYGVGAVFLVCNNAQYQILKVGAQGLQLPEAGRGRYEGLDLVEPEIDLVRLARALGVDACRISEPEQLSERLVEAWSDNRPLVIDVPIARDVPRRLDYG